MDYATVSTSVEAPVLMAVQCKVDRNERDCFIDILNVP